MTLKHLLFDLDGTIVESSKGIINGFHYALDALNHPQLSDQVLQTFIGPPLETTFETLSQGDSAWAAKATATYRQYYTAKGMFEAQVYEGILEMLDELHHFDYQLYIATSKKETVAQNMLQALDLSHHFKGIYGSTPETMNKSLVIKKVLQTTEARAENSVMIGDRAYDIIGGINNKVAKTIGVLWGFGDEDELTKAGSDILIAHPQQLLESIR
ncbi:MAG: HAD hydrolase-like protein [Streptococcaceae bacterium]|jgi:phosphoglycolate phosphatase|nr:HAD hydrolase-like protein [Streptococcaceae bacterium]